MEELKQRDLEQHLFEHELLHHQAHAHSPTAPDPSPTPNTFLRLESDMELMTEQNVSLTQLVLSLSAKVDLLTQPPPPVDSLHHSASADTSVLLI
jgi:hypothetical protein